VALRRAIEAGADPNTRDVGCWTPLFHAAWRGNIAIIEILVQVGADVNQGAEKGFTALFAAILGEHAEAIRVSLDAGARVRTGEGVDLATQLQNRTTIKGRKILEMLERAKAEQGQRASED